MSNIFINNNNKIETKLSLRDYWDFSLSKEKDPYFIPNGDDLYDVNLISNFDVSNNKCISGTTLYGDSNYIWENAINNGVLLKDIGYTSTDNGLLTFDIDTITTTELQTLITGSTLQIYSGDTRLVLDQVTGNTKQYIYPIDYVSGSTDIYYALNGGFFQGVFKINDDYQILPTSANDGLCFEFRLIPDFVSFPLDKTLNKTHPSNKGIFFYMGTRAENKFWYYYNNSDKTYFDVKNISGYTTGLTYNTGYTTSTGHFLNEQGVVDVVTDNKFLFFNETSGGTRVSTYDPTIPTRSFSFQETNSVNYFPLYNRTESGSTVCSGRPSEDTPNYNLIDDLVGNAICFKINDDGSIGYRTLNIDCYGEAISGLTYTYKVDEEFSPSGVTIDNKESLISIRLIMSGNSKCGNSKRNYRLLFYVDGKLVLTSKELPELTFRFLNDLNEKQELVPFNISIGGGSQGLSDMIGIDSVYLLPIEKHFCGTFIGKFKKFRLYNNKMDFSKIQNNYLYEFGLNLLDNYLAPTPTISITSLSGLTYPETNTLREIGDTDSIINGNILVNNKNFPLTGYTLKYYTDNGYSGQLNGLFSISPTGGTITTYTHNDQTLKNKNIRQIKYAIEVFDMRNINNGTRNISSVYFDDLIFFGNSSLTPTGSTDVRNLTGRTFNDETTTIEINTGVDKIFTFAIPESREVVSVIDEMALNADISIAYNLQIIQIADAGGLLKNYKVYTLANAIPYSRNHKHIITLN